MPSLYLSASATRERFRAFIARSFSTFAVVSDLGELVGDIRPIAPPTTLAFASSG
jgi:hypothetical protein